MSSIVVVGANWGDEGKGRIVDYLAGQAGASIRFQPSGNTLRYCGVTGSCTWSDGRGLLDAWERNAARTLSRPPQEEPADA